MGNPTDLPADKRGLQKLRGLFQNDFKSGRDLRPELVNKTLSEAAQLALIEMGELRRGLLQDYPPDVNRCAIDRAKLLPELRQLLIKELEKSPIVLKSNTARFSPAKYSVARLQPFSPQNSKGRASTSGSNELQAGTSSGGKSLFPQATTKSSSGNSSLPHGSPASAVSKAPFGVLKDPVLAPLGVHTGNMSNLSGQSKRVKRDEQPYTSIAGILRDPANQGKKRKRVQDESPAVNRVKETPVPTPKLPVIPSSAPSRPTVPKPVQSSQPASAKSNQSFGLQTKGASSAAMSWNPPAKLDHASTSRMSSAPRFHAAENSRHGATFAPITTSSPVSRSANRSGNMDDSANHYFDPDKSNNAHYRAYGEWEKSKSEASTSENGGNEAMVENEESEDEDEADDEEVLKADFDKFLSDCREEDDADEEEAVTFEDGNDSEDEQVVVHDGESHAQDEEFMEGESNADAEEKARFEGESYAEDEEVVMEGENDDENKEVMEDQEDNIKDEEEMAYEVQSHARDEEVYEGEYFDEAEEEAVSESENYAQDEDVEMEDDNVEAEEESHQSEEGNEVDDTRPTTDNFAASGWTEAPGAAESIVSDISSITHSRHVLRADGGRTYSTWIFDGKRIPAYGALLPSQYQLYDDAETPWICPIRSCRNLLKSLQGLGGHFNRKHRAVELNDNRDGTFSEVGHYTGDGPLPATVVSKESPDPNEPPMQTPALPLPTHGKKRADPDTANNQNDPKQSLRKANLAPQSISRGRAAKQEAHRKIQIVENWYKIWPHLQNTPIMEVPTTGHVQSLLPLDLQRDVVFNRKAPVYFERRSQDISALIIQMTGVEAPRPCTRCQQGKGPFSGCFLISPEAAPETRKQITSCANCFYKGNQSRCSEFIKQQKETPPESQGENASAAENDVNVETEQQTPARRSGRSSNRPDAASPPKPAT